MASARLSVREPFCPDNAGCKRPSHALSAENEKKADPSMRMPPRTYTLFAAGLLFGCSSSSVGTAAKGSGGSSGSGGVGHNGGSGAGGGAAGTGGLMGVGGTAVGGAVATGGTSGINTTGGTNATGGTSGTGGINTTG